MISWLKNTFIPHEGNEHRPHFLGKENLRNVVLIIILLETSTFLIPTLIQINRTGGMAAVLPAVLSNLTNEERQDENLKFLTVNKNLNKAAEMKAEDMAINGYFAHTSPTGKTPWYWIEKVGYKYQYAGENLAINFNDSKDVTDAWMNSPTHKANIVKGTYTEMGTGVAVGMYEGQETTFVAQVYANPMPKVFEQVVPKKTDTKKIQSDIVGVNKETSKDILGEETVAVNPINETTPLVVEKTTNTISTQKPTFFQKIFSSPRNTINKILFSIFGIIVVSLLLNIFIKIKHHHADLITNGLITLAIILAIVVTNNYLSKSKMVIIESIDYSSLHI